MPLLETRVLDAAAVSGEPVSAADKWYVLPKPPVSCGWLIFSDVFIGERLRKALGSDSPLARALGGALGLTLIKLAIGLVQAIVMVLGRIPIVGWLVGDMAQNAGRHPLGFVLRASYWRAHLRGLGQDTLFDQGVSIWGARSIEIGYGSYLGMGVMLSAGDHGTSAPSEIIIGDFSYLGPMTLLSGSGRIIIGDFAALSSSVRLYSATNLPTRPEQPGVLASMAHSAPGDRQAVQVGEINIGDYAVVGIGSVVYPNITIGQGAIVHAYAEVRRSFPAYANITGAGRARQNGFRLPLRPDPRLAAMEASPEHVPPGR